jgi:hypothetical protein
LNVGKDEVRSRYGIIQRHLASVDPGDGQAERLAANQIRKLRLPGMQNFFLGAAGMLDQVTKQRAVRLVALRPLRRTHEVELSLQRRQREQIVIDVGHDRQPVAARQSVERTDDIVVEKEASERIEIVVDQAPLAGEELVAELGSAFLCAEFGFDGDLRHAGYIGHWIELLKADKRAFFTACSQASKAADYLRGLALAEPAERAA